MFTTYIAGIPALTKIHPSFFGWNGARHLVMVLVQTSCVVSLIPITPQYDAACYIAKYENPAGVTLYLGGEFATRLGSCKT